MPNPLTKAEADTCPAAAHPVLMHYLAGEVSAEITLMHLLLAAGTLQRLNAVLQQLGVIGRTPLARLAQLGLDHAAGLARAARLVEAGLTEAQGDDRLAAVREQYDNAVAAAPEAAVALYSLGDPAILERATTELAGLLCNWGLLGADRDALDIGCGIGRFEKALAPRLRSIVGIDLSPAMIAEAKRRCVGITNVQFHVCNGRDLSQFSKASFDLILAVDSLPCIVAIGSEIAARYIGDAAHMLKPGGTLAIFNYSYRGDIEADRADISAFAKSAGLEVVRDGSRDLALWDGTSFLLRAPPRRG